MTDIQIAPSATRPTREVVQFLAREGFPSINVALTDGPCEAPGFVALADGALIGVALGGEAPAIEPGESYVFPTVVVAIDHRRLGVGRRFVDALADEPRSAATSWLVAMPRKTEADASAFLEAVGFEPRDEAILYERDTALVSRRGGLMAAVYDGGDDARNDVLADLYRRAFRGRFGVFDLGRAGVRAWCVGQIALVLEDGGRVAGCGFVNVASPTASISAMFVPRPYWGGPAADTLMDAMTALAHEHGCARIVGAVHRGNHACRRMVVRHGWAEVERVPYLARRSGVMEAPSPATDGDTLPRDRHHPDRRRD